MPPRARGGGTLGGSTRGGSTAPTRGGTTGAPPARGRGTTGAPPPRGGGTTGTTPPRGGGTTSTAPPRGGGTTGTTPPRGGGPTSAPTRGRGGAPTRGTPTRGRGGGPNQGAPNGTLPPGSAPATNDPLEKYFNSTPGYSALNIQYQTDAKEYQTEFKTDPEDEAKIIPIIKKLLSLAQQIDQKRTTAARTVPANLKAVATPAAIGRFKELITFWQKALQEEIQEAQEEGQNVDAQGNYGPPGSTPAGQNGATDAQALPPAIYPAVAQLPGGSDVTPNNTQVLQPANTSAFQKFLQGGPNSYQGFLDVAADYPNAAGADGGFDSTGQGYQNGQDGYGDPNAGYNVPDGGAYSGGGYEDPNAGGYEDPNAGGYEDPNAGGYEDPNAGGYEDPNAGGYEDPNAGGYGEYPPEGGYEGGEPPNDPNGEPPYDPNGEPPYDPEGEQPYPPEGEQPYPPGGEGDQSYPPEGEGDQSYPPEGEGDQSYPPEDEGEQPYDPSARDNPRQPPGEGEQLPTRAPPVGNSGPLKGPGGEAIPSSTTPGGVYKP